MRVKNISDVTLRLWNGAARVVLEVGKRGWVDREQALGLIKLKLLEEVTGDDEKPPVADVKPRQVEAKPSSTVRKKALSKRTPPTVRKKTASRKKASPRRSSIEDALR